MLTSKRAYTLTELLVVVIVIGILAAVSLPKYTKMLETRKTTEAEGIMRAIRTEQERRCALDKNYFGDLSAMSDLVPTADTEHYTYAALTGGVSAQSKGKLNYQLQIPSYADGRLCCEGADCNQLNKDYPTCAELRAKPDYVEPPDNCAAKVTELPDPSCPGTAKTQTYDCCSQEDKYGTKTRTQYCNGATEQWEWGAWQGECTPAPVETYTDSRPCESGSANETRVCTKTHKCDGTHPVKCGSWSGCYRWELVKKFCSGACSGDGPCSGDDPNGYDCVTPDHSTCSASTLGSIRTSAACSYDPQAGTHGEGGFALAFCYYRCMKI